MSRVWQVTGRNFTGKSTFAVSDLVGKCAYAELDAGSFERTALDENSNILVSKFYPPLTALEDIGVVRIDSAGQSGRGGISIVHTYKGWQEAWEQVNKWILEACAAGDVSRGVIDTASLLWDMMQNATRQRAQASGLSADQLAKIPPALWNIELKQRKVSPAALRRRRTLKKSFLPRATLSCFRAPRR